MPKRKRRDREPSAPAAAPTPSDAPVDPNVALFAQRHKEQQERQKEAQRAEAARRKQEAEHQRLQTAKDDAVARVKALRRRDRVSAEEAAEADTAYKAALAALIEHETGAPPPWAATNADSPAPEVDDVDDSEADTNETEGSA